MVLILPSQYCLTQAALFFQKDVLRIVGVLIEDDNAPFPLHPANCTIAVEELVRIEIASAGPDKPAGWTVEVDEHKTAFAGNDRILPVEKKDLFVRNHFFVFQFRGNERTRRAG